MTSVLDDDPRDAAREAALRAAAARRDGVGGANTGEGAIDWSVAAEAAGEAPDDSGDASSSGNPAREAALQAAAARRDGVGGANTGEGAVDWSVAAEAAGGVPAPPSGGEQSDGGGRSDDDPGASTREAALQAAAAARGWDAGDGWTFTPDGDAFAGQDDQFM